MRLRILYHDNCFDGIASAAVFGTRRRPLAASAFVAVAGFAVPRFVGAAVRGRCVVFAIARASVTIISPGAQATTTRRFLGSDKIGIDAATWRRLEVLHLSALRVDFGRRDPVDLSTFGAKSCGKPYFAVDHARRSTLRKGPEPDNSHPLRRFAVDPAPLAVDRSSRTIPSTPMRSRLGAC